MVKVKICCISSIEEARLAVAYGAAAIGLVGRMPSGPGIITDELIHAIAKTVPPPTHTFLLTSETTTDNIIEHHKKVNTTTIQIVDALSGREYHKIREAIPNVQLVQVIHVLDVGSIKEAIEISEFVDAILLDSGYSRSKALLYNVLASLTTVLGGILAYFSLEDLHDSLPYFLALAASSFIYIAVADLIPSLHTKTDMKTSLQQIVLIAAGVLLICSLQTIAHNIEFT